MSKPLFLCDIALPRALLDSVRINRSTLLLDSDLEAVLSVFSDLLSVRLSRELSGRVVVSAQISDYAPAYLIRGRSSAPRMAPMPESLRGT